MTCRDRPEQSGQTSPPGLPLAAARSDPRRELSPQDRHGASPSHRRTPWAPDPQRSISPCAAPPWLPLGVRGASALRRFAGIKPGRGQGSGFSIAQPTRQCKDSAGARQLGRAHTACPAGGIREVEVATTAVCSERGAPRARGRNPYRYDVNPPIRAPRLRPLRARGRRVVRCGTAGTSRSAARARARAPRPGQARGRGRAGGSTRGGPSSPRSGRRGS